MPGYARKNISVTVAEKKTVIKKSALSFVQKNAKHFIRLGANVFILKNKQGIFSYPRPAPPPSPPMTPGIYIK